MMKVRPELLERIQMTWDRVSDLPMASKYTYISGYIQSLIDTGHITDKTATVIMTQILDGQMIYIGPEEDPELFCSSDTPTKTGEEVDR